MLFNLEHGLLHEEMKQKLKTRQAFLRSAKLNILWRVRTNMVDANRKHMDGIAKSTATTNYSYDGRHVTKALTTVNHFGVVDMTTATIFFENIKECNHGVTYI